MDFLSAAWDTIQSRVLHEDSHIHHSHNSYVGYWGKPTSTVDWCEVNYEVTHYVAEFFNTFSSFAMVITGMMGVMFHWRDLENRFLLGFLSVGIVGVGSAAFHGTLLFGLQMMDELPMIYAALIMTYAMVEHNNVKRKYGYYLPAALIIHGILTTILVGFPAIAPEYSSPVLQFICFHISFALLESFVIFRNIKIWMTERDPKIRRLHVLGMGLWLAAIAFWIIDYTGCETLWEGEDSFRRRYLFLTINNTRVHLPNPQFHAWWHICAASGLYYITLVGACNRMIVLGKPSRVGVLFWIFPYVHVLSEEEKRKLMVDKSVDASDIVGRADTNKSSRGRRRSLTEPEGDNTSQPAETSSSSASATRRRRRQQA